MKIAIASDHAGFSLKEALKAESIFASHDIIDLGTDSLKNVDYPDFAYKVIHAILNGTVETGILICGTGVGMSITANRFNQIRAAVCYDVTSAHLARSHNNANILCMGGRLTGITTAADITRTFLTTSFEGGRHLSRLQKIELTTNSHK